MNITMNGSDKTVDDLEACRKRLIYRSWHRGTREMDLILGSFADKHIMGFSAAELALYEDILHHSDPDLYNWITRTEPVPANFLNSVLEKLLAHSYLT